MHDGCTGLVKEILMILQSSEGNSEGQIWPGGSPFDISGTSNHKPALRATLSAKKKKQRPKDAEDTILIYFPQPTWQVAWWIHQYSVPTIPAFHHALLQAF